MKSTARWAGLAVVSGLIAIPPLMAADISIVGDWAGGFGEGRDSVFMVLHFKSAAGKLSGTYDAPLLFQQGRPLTRISLELPGVSFQAGNGADSRRFTGEVLDGGLLTGRMKSGALDLAFRFHRLAPIEADRYLGTYEIEPGRFVFIRAALELGIGALQFIDFTTGRVGALFPTTETDFFTGPGILVLDPVEARVSFARDDHGQATELRWSGGEHWRARRVVLREEEVSFTNGAVGLAGTLILPKTPPPHPVLICAAGGTAAGVRGMFRHIAEFFALHGVASLIYDKRGLGKSTGDWLRASFEDLAGDTLAAVRMLKERPDINGRRIGLFGASQSGWVVALAASQSKDVAFIISQSGPGVTPEEQELYRSEAWLRADGFAEDDIRDAMAFIRQRYQCALTGAGWEALAETGRVAQTKSWFAYTGGNVGKDHPFWHFWALIRSYDPVPALKKVTCPVLAVFGAKDTFLPVEKSAALWKAALENAGNKDATVRVFPNGDHSLIESESGGLKEAARARRFVPGFFDLLREWAQKRVE